ncbi:hypothetical protein HDV00_011210 [Rhizophlyctis rosea]|nr:hypothetical protein HDV00_011210 [Rhizophlyctis rosea]
MPADLRSFVQKVRDQFEDDNMTDTLGDWHIAKYLMYARSVKAKEEDAIKAVQSTLDFRRQISFQTLFTNPTTFTPHHATGKLYWFHRTKTSSPILIWRACKHYPPPPPPPTNPLLPPSTSPPPSPSPHSLNETVRHLLYTIESAKRHGLLKDNEKATILIDRSDLKNENKDPALLKLIVTVLGSHYPEHMEKIFIFPRNWMLMVGWGVIKGFLSPAVVNRIEILGNDYPSILQKHIDKDSLVERYGGNLKDPFEGGEEFDYMSSGSPKCVEESPTASSTGSIGVEGKTKKTKGILGGKFKLVA